MHGRGGTLYQVHRPAERDQGPHEHREVHAKRHERAAALSGGQQQILAVAQGLVRRPRLLMLDEPLGTAAPSGEDTAQPRRARRRVWNRSANLKLRELLLDGKVENPFYVPLSDATA